MRHLSKRTLIGLAATAATIGICLSGLTGPAGATGTDYTVLPAGTTSVTATNAGNLVFQDTKAVGAKFTCTSATGSGSAYGGGHGYVPATPAAPYIGYDPALDLNSISLSCTNSLIGPLSVTPSTLPWHLGCTATILSGGVVTGCTGYLYGISVNIVLSTCQFTLTGALYGSYDNASHTFTGATAPGLTISNTAGPLCPIFPFSNGDRMYMSGKLVLSPALTVS